ncbi:MAG: T9SS type A sorting domain-containing protein [Bacteroidia bacterium]|nr:T9SS type A sorting domain-containing protein [Bacteroidia bacterium]
MRRLLLIFLFPIVGLSQNYAGDHEGNIYQWINYGTLDWSVKNAENSTYRDGTEIPQVTDPTAWSNLTTGAWCYIDNDSNNGKLYNWYAIAGVHDNDASTSNKTFAPAGWRVPSDAEWTTLENHLISNGFNYDSSTSGNKIAKSMASTTGWTATSGTGYPGDNQVNNNSSQFNAFPKGQRNGVENNSQDNGKFVNSGTYAQFWTSSETSSTNAKYRYISGTNTELKTYSPPKKYGYATRLISDTQSTTNSNGLIMHFPFDGNTNELINNTPVNTRTTAYANDRNGNLNKAFYFDGTDANFINGNMPEHLNGDYTYSMWIKPISFTKSWLFVFGELGTASTLGFSGNNLRIGTWGNDGLDTGYAGFTEWKHVLVTFTKSSSSFSLYINGAHQYTGTKNSSFVSTFFQVGTQIDEFTDEAFNGYMDDLMVWNRVLSQTEITQAYNGTLSLSKTLDFLNVYPNPTSSIINIDYEFSISKVFDLTGRKVLESRLKTIDLSELPNSIYLLRLYDNSNNVLGTSKVIKK